MATAKCECGGISFSSTSKTMSCGNVNLIYCHSCGKIVGVVK